MNLLQRLSTALLLAALPKLAQAAPFTFHAPPGWLDLSPGAPKENFDRASPQLRAAVQGKKFLLFAADQEHVQQDGFLTNVSAMMITDKPVKITKESLDMAVAGYGPGYSLGDKSLIDVGGVTVGRLVGELTLDGGKAVPQLAFLLPGADGDAMMTFSTTKERLARDQGLFELAMRATTGLAESESSELPPWVLGGAIGFAVAIGLVINAKLTRNRNRDVWAKLEPVLQRGPATLPELAEAVGMTGLMAKGKVALALQEKTVQGKVELTPAPEGTPQLEKVKLIKYRLRSSASS